MRRYGRSSSRMSPAGLRGGHYRYDWASWQPVAFPDLCGIGAAKPRGRRRMQKPGRWGGTSAGHGRVRRQVAYRLIPSGQCSSQKRWHGRWKAPHYHGVIRRRRTGPGVAHGVQAADRLELPVQALVVAARPRGLPEWPAACWAAGNGVVGAASVGCGAWRPCQGLVAASGAARCSGPRVGGAAASVFMTSIRSPRRRRSRLGPGPQSCRR